jgi:hypothetical protein
MTLHPNLRSRISAIDDELAGIAIEARELLDGREARLHLPGRQHDGRRGRIAGVTVGEEGVRVCLMIYRKGTAEVLNTEGWTRSYRPLSEVRFEGEDG